MPLNALWAKFDRGETKLNETEKNVNSALCGAVEPLTGKPEIRKLGKSNSKLRSFTARL